MAKIKIITQPLDIMSMAAGCHTSLLNKGVVFADKIILNFKYATIPLSGYCSLMNDIRL